MKIKILASLAISIYILIQTNTSVSAYQGSTETEFGPIEITTKDNFSMNDSASVVIKNEGNLRQKAKRILYSLFNSKKIPTIDIKNQNGEIVKKTRIPLSKSQIKLANAIPGKYNVNLNNSKITSFNWGVLAINTNKSEYRLGETVDIHMAVLDPMGEMVCNAQLELAVQNKTTGKRESFSTEDTSIVVLPGCSSKELILDGDYMMHYQTSEIGNFELILKATTKYGEYTINDNFTVNQDLNHSVERITATRIYPALDYPVIFRVNLKQNYSGKISDFVPDEFKTKKISKNEVEKHLGISLNDYQFIETKSNKPEWKVNLEKNTDYYFGYYYDAPNLSPAFYNIGPLKIDKYLETRSWQIAVDSVDNCITIVGYASNPFYDLENGTTGKIGPTLAVTPPTGMASGDVVIIFAHYRGSATLTMSETGGQSWTALTQATQSTTNTSRIFYAVYNGTWSADPSVTVTSGTATLSLSMHVYRGIDGSSPLDVTQTASGFSAPSTPFDVTITGITTNTNGALALAFWASQDDNQYQLRTDGTDGWEATGHSQIRNQGGSDTSLTMAYKYTPTAGATGDITVRQVTLGGDAGTRHILALKPATPTSANCNPLYGYASNPFYDLENGTTGKIGPTLAVTPPTGMASGDVVIIFAHYRGSATLSMSETGGQSWTALTQATQSTTNTSRIFYATFNGSWSADPSVTVTSGTATLSVSMYVFRGYDVIDGLDVAQTASGFAAPSTPFDVTISGITTNTNGALALAFWASQDDNQWELRSGGSGWQNMRSASIRNQGGTDNSISAAYKFMPSTGSTGNVTNRQVNLGGDAGTHHILALKPATASAPPNTPTLDSPSNGATEVSLTPDLQTTADDDNHNHLQYQIELCEDSGMTTNCQVFDQTDDQTGWSGQNYSNYSSWSHRMQIDIDSSQVPSNLEYFPVLISTTRNELRDTGNSGNVGKSNGGDIFFTAADGATKLKHEVEKYDNSTGELIAWVQVPNLSSSTDTILHMYYGNSAAADQWDTQSTWNDNGNNYYVGVWHLKEAQSGSSNQYLDSSSQANHFSTSSTVSERPSQTAGKIGFAENFIRSNNQNMRKTSGLTGFGTSRSNQTVSLWYKVPSNPTTDQRLFCLENSGYTEQSCIYFENSTGRLGVGQTWESPYNQWIYTASPPTAGSWHHFVWTWDGTDSRLYINGSQVSTNTTQPDRDFVVDHIWAGSNSSSGSSFFDGDLDELRYALTARSADWIATEYNNQNDPSSFTTFGSEESNSAGIAYTSGSQATYTIQSPLAGSTTYYWRSYAIDPSGTNTWSDTQITPYSFTTESGNTPPNAPSSPQAEGATNPTGIVDLTPEFSAIHTDPDSDPALHYEIEVNTASDFSGTVMWDSAQQSMASLASGDRSSDISYAGTSLTYNGATYYWRIRFWDSNGAVSDWSAVQSFSTNSIPSTPSLDSPANSATGVSLTPSLLTTTTDTDSDYLRYRIELCENEAMTTNCQTYDQTSSQTGWSGQNTQTSTAYTSGTQATYTLQSPLTGLTTYYWRSYAIDPAGSNTWSGTQTPRSFTTQVATGDFNFKGLNFKGINLE